MHIGETILLKGQYDSYVLALNDSKSIIKQNGEISSTYLGIANNSDKKVIIKRFHPSLYNHPEYQFRFEKEYEATKLCTELNPDFFEQDGIKYLVTDYIDGITVQALKQWRYRRKLKTSDYFGITINIIKALRKIHNAGFIHCDLKPTNIIIETNNTKEIPHAPAHIIDMGLAQRIGEKPALKHGKLPFSLIYSAPEQMLNLWELLDYRTDIYALGVTIWQLFTQQIPWETDNPLKTIHIQLTQPLPQSRKVPENLKPILLKMCSKPHLTKPPRYYSRKKLLELTTEAMDNRYNSTLELENEIVQIADLE